MEQFKNHPRLSGLYNRVKYSARNPLSLAAPIYMVLGIAAALVLPTDKAQLICETVGYVLVAVLAAAAVVNFLRDHRQKIAHVKFLEAQREREAELKAWVDRSELK